MSPRQENTVVSKLYVGKGDDKHVRDFMANRMCCGVYAVDDNGFSDECEFMFFFFSLLVFSDPLKSLSLFFFFILMIFISLPVAENRSRSIARDKGRPRRRTIQKTMREYQNEKKNTGISKTGR